MAIIQLKRKLYTTGSTITLNDRAERYIPNAREGLSVIIHRVRNGNLVGLYSPDSKISGWGNLDEEVGDGRGWWVEAEQLAECIGEVIDHVFEVGNDFEYRGTNLKGKACKIVANFTSGNNVFVEFEEHVNGCSADGMGKSGHCVALNKNILTKKKRVKHAK